jgi:hypothetical protein
MILVDTNILGTFARVERLELLLDEWHCRRFRVALGAHLRLTLTGGSCNLPAVEDCSWILGRPRLGFSGPPRLSALNLSQGGSFHAQDNRYGQRRQRQI